MVTNRATRHIYICPFFTIFLDVCTVKIFSMVTLAWPTHNINVLSQNLLLRMYHICYMGDFLGSLVYSLHQVCPFRLLFAKCRSFCYNWTASYGNLYLKYGPRDILKWLHLIGLFLKFDSIPSTSFCLAVDH